MAVAACCFSLASVKNLRLSTVPAAGDGGRWQTPQSSGLAAPPSLSVSRKSRSPRVFSSFCSMVTISLTAKVALHAFNRDSDFGFETGSLYESEKGGFSFDSEESFSFDDDKSFNKDKGLGFNNQRLNSNEGFEKSSEFKSNKLFVGNLPWSADEKRLEDIFQEAGRVELVEVIYENTTKRSRGFAFVTMSSAEEAEAAVSKLDGYSLGGRAIRVNIASLQREGGSVRNSRGFASGNNYVNAFGSPQSDDSSKVFVGNLPWGVDNATLENIFASYGVVEARVVYDRDTGRSRGFGYVTLASPSEASEAISELNGSDIEGRSLRVNLAGERPPRRF